MKSVVCICLLLLTCTSWSQKSRKYNGKSRRDYFGGAEDYRTITKNALQISFGPNYTITRLNNQSFSGVDDANNRPYDASIDPSGRFGAFVDLGMAHYRLKPSRVLESIYKARGEKGAIKWIGGNLIHRIDWGLGFDYVGGQETTTANYYTFNVQAVSEGKFYNGSVYGRITADRFTLLNERWHLETGFGFNANYRLLTGSQQLSNGIYAPQVFQRNFMLQFHGHIGFNYKVRRGDYLVMGLYVPVIGIVEPNKLKPTVQWYSSNYWPVYAQLKWIHHFTKKSKGCNTGTPEDRKRNEEYMQNR
jgi:hypothetical protein